METRGYILRFSAIASALVCLSALFGAPLSVPTTYLWLVLQLLLVAAPAALYIERVSDIPVLLCQPDAWASQSPLLLPAAGALFGSWLGAVIIPLDWGVWWQAWPVGSTVASTAGFIAGLLILGFFRLFSLLGLSTDI